MGLTENTFIPFAIRNRMKFLRLNYRVSALLYWVVLESIDFGRTDCVLGTVWAETLFTLTMLINVT